MDGRMACEPAIALSATPRRASWRRRWNHGAVYYEAVVIAPGRGIPLSVGLALLCGANLLVIRGVQLHAVAA